MIVSEQEWNELSNYRDSLEHHGVKGMKWGEHKERETSGRRVSAKQKSKIQNRMSFFERRKKERAKKAKEAEKKRAEAKARKEATRRQNMLRSPTKLYKNRYDFTQDEINAALKQFEWENKLRDYSQKEMQSGKKYIDNVFQYATSAINVYNTAARVVNSFDLSEKPWKYVEPVKTDKKKDKKED